MSPKKPDYARDPGGVPSLVFLLAVLAAQRALLSAIAAELVSQLAKRGLVDAGKLLAAAAAAAEAGVSAGGPEDYCRGLADVTGMRAEAKATLAEFVQEFAALVEAAGERET